MTKKHYLMLLRRCKTKKTLDIVVEKKAHQLNADDLWLLYSAADHRLAEITMGKLYDNEIPVDVWQHII